MVGPSNISRQPLGEIGDQPNVKESAKDELEKASKESRNQELKTLFKAGVNITGKVMKTYAEVSTAPIVVSVHLTEKALGVEKENSLFKDSNLQVFGRKLATSPKLFIGAQVKSLRDSMKETKGIGNKSDLAQQEMYALVDQILADPNQCDELGKLLNEFALPSGKGKVFILKEGKIDLVDVKSEEATVENRKAGMKFHLALYDRGTNLPPNDFPIKEKPIDGMRPAVYMPTYIQKMQDREAEMDVKVAKKFNHQFEKLKAKEQKMFVARLDTAVNNRILILNNAINVMEQFRPYSGVQLEDEAKGFIGKAEELLNAKKKTFDTYGMKIGAELKIDEVTELVVQDVDKLHSQIAAEIKSSSLGEKDKETELANLDQFRRSIKTSLDWVGDKPLDAQALKGFVDMAKKYLK